MTELKPVYEHEVPLPATAVAGAAAAAAVRTRLVAVLTMFVRRPELLIEGLCCRRVTEHESDAGALVFERELVAGRMTFADAVTVTDDRVLFAVPAAGDMRASTFAIEITGGDGTDFVLRFHYEEDATAVLPENLQTLRIKAWRAKDQDLAAWCVKQLGF